MNNKKDFFSTVFCIFIAVLFILGCNNHLLKPHQDEAHLIVKIANSTGARNVSSEIEYNITAWIENRDGSQSHYQEISTKENNLILTFEDLVIGSQINIHLELTKNDDSQTKLTGESGWFPVKEGEQVIEIELKSMTNTDDSGGGNGSTSGGETEGDEPAIVDAETPVITQQPHGKSQTFEPNTATSVTTTLEIDASVGDGGDLTYQWYSNTSNSTSGGTLINGATDPSYTASTGAKSTTYYYCVITNTNNDVNGKTTASVTSYIAAISSIEGTLTGITAQYIGNHELVNSEINYSNIEIQQIYTAGSETQVVTVSAEEVKDQYTIDLPENTIGMVPATVIHTETKKETTVDIPVKYELNAGNLTISGDSSVEQNGTLSLTANYADASGSTITYKKYDGGSSSTYNVKDYVTISWTGGATGSSWQANADTTSTGQQTATVTLTSTDDEWCVTEKIEKPHEYTVLALGSQDNPVTTWEQLTSAIASTTNPIYVDTNSMEVTSTIEITGTTEIIPLKDLTIERTSNFTNKFFDVKTGGDLTLGDGSNTITLDGKGLYASEPLVDTSGNLTLNKVELKNGNNTSDSSTGGIFIYSGETTLNNVIFSGNTSGTSGAKDIYLYYNGTLTLDNSFSAEEIHFNATSKTPVLRLGEHFNSDSKVSIIVSSYTTTLTGIPVITKNGYTGDLNDLFTIVATDDTTYTLNDEGKVEVASISNYDEGIGLSYDSTSNILTIHNEAGLKNFRDIVNGSLTQAITVDGETFSGTDRTVSATLANNITLTGEWTPIGKSAAPYAGNFDGAGHTVSGISITSGMDKGFFGYIQSQATIANLIVEGNISGSTYVGGIVAHSKGGNISYCINKINVTNTSTGETGGIVGYISIGTTITGCVNFGTITGVNYTGGIVGKNTSSGGGTTIDRCMNFGTITSTSSSAYVGGIYGYSLLASDTITNSANFGSIVSSYYGAGIVNYDASNDTTQYCLNVGDMTGVTTPNKNYPIANTDSSDLPNYYDSSKIGNTSVPSKGGTGKATSELKVDSAWDTSWIITNWSFASGRYPVPNIQDNIPSEIWKDIVEKAQQ